jgi:hypothetical protein
MLKLAIEEGKLVRVNAYKRITKGNVIAVTLDGDAVEAIVDAKGKYTYLAVRGVDSYVAAALVDGGVYVTSEVGVTAKKPRKAKPAPAESEGQAA